MFPARGSKVSRLHGAGAKKENSADNLFAGRWRHLALELVYFLPMKTVCLERGASSVSCDPLPADRLPFLERPARMSAQTPGIQGPLRCLNPSLLLSTGGSTLCPEHNLNGLHVIQQLGKDQWEMMKLNLILLLTLLSFRYEGNAFFNEWTSWHLNFCVVKTSIT